jgi:hypothetical protein
LSHIYINVLRKIDFVDDEKIRSANTRSAFARHVASARHVDHKDLRINQGRRERGGEVVSATLNKDNVQGREVALQIFHGKQVHRYVIAYGRMRAGARLDRPNAFYREHAFRAQEAGILVGVDVIGDDTYLKLMA